MIGFFIGVSLIQRMEDFAVYFVVLLNLHLITYRILITLLNSENLLISAVRCLKIVNFPAEPDVVTEFDKNIMALSANESERSLGIPDNQNCSIKFDNFSMRYRGNLPVTLKNLQFTIDHREKVAIVGRTGSGKSTIIQCLIRLYEPEEGSTYKFCGQDALKMGLHTLRRQIALIPQSPFLMKTTIRENLDPDTSNTEERIWKALDGCGLKEKIE